MSNIISTNNYYSVKTYIKKNALNNMQQLTFGDYFNKKIKKEVMITYFIFYLLGLILLGVE